MNDLFTPTDQLDEITLRNELTEKWKGKFPEAPDDLIKAKVDADIYIKTIERQKDELRSDFIKAQDEIQKSKSLEELIDRLNKKDETPPPTPLKDVVKPSMDLDEISKVFDSRYEAKKQSEIETENFNIVQNKLKDRFGNRAAEILVEQREALGLTKEDVNALAKKSPEAFFRMLGLNQEKDNSFMAPPRSDVRNDHFAPKTQKRTYSFYEEMRAKKPKEYWDPKMQVQMHKDGEALGAAFFDDGQPIDF
jgi:hypothetical protein